jgi:hypothetical protein
VIAIDCRYFILEIYSNIPRHPVEYPSASVMIGTSDIRYRKPRMSGNSSRCTDDEIPSGNASKVLTLLIRYKSGTALRAVSQDVFTPSKEIQSTQMFYLPSHNYDCILFPLLSLLAADHDPQ